MSKRPLKVIISGGGTGGHVFPAISIAQELIKQVPGAEILFVGAEDRLEMTKVPEAGFKIVGLPVRGLDRKNMIRNIGIVRDLIRSMYRAKKIIRDFVPDGVVGVGGYASAPVVKVAGRRKIPVLLQEQNSYAGVTNRWLARHAKVICVAYEEMNRYFPREKILYTGNPVRDEIRTHPVSKASARAFFNAPETVKTVLIIGGSLGAGSINHAMLQGLSSLRKKSMYIIWQTGKYDYEKLVKETDPEKYSNLHMTPFIERMDMAYAAADLIISRAGAGTISELAVIGKPVILVPSPAVAEDHQTKNAQALASRNAAVLIPDHQLDAMLIPELLRLLNDDHLMQELSSNLKKIAVPDASTRIVNKLLTLIAKDTDGE